MEDAKAYEKVLIDSILKIFSKIDYRFNILAEEIAREIAPYRDTLRFPKVQDLVLNKVEKLLSGLNEAIYSDILQNIKTAIVLAENKNDELVKEILKISGETVVTVSILKLLNRKFEKGTTYSLNEAMKLERMENVYREIISNKIDGLTLSDRVWNLSGSNKDLIEHYLKSGFADGNGAASLGKDLKQFLNNPTALFRRVRNDAGKLVLSKPAANYHPGQGVYRSAAQNVKRLAANETNIAYRKTDHDRQSKNPGVVGIEVHLSKSHPQPDICNSLTGKYPKSFLFTGWHVRCFCYSTAILLTDKEHDKFIDSLLNDEPFNIKSENTIEGVPGQFNQWIDQNKVKIKDMKSQPFFVRDNFKDGNIEKGLKSVQ